jgi:predicted house-cleaning noncanonical NTP pyrophosphatase (MazG superfamily)
MNRNYINHYKDLLMRTFLSKKLWRDKIIEMVEADGSKVHWRRLNDQEFEQQLRVKLLEEAEEVRNTQLKDELIAELADLYEVIDTLIAANNIIKEEIIAEQIKKRDSRGGFAERIFVEMSQHPADSPGEKYCLADPKKYPEIV